MVQMVHLRRFTMATMMMAMVGVVSGWGLVCIHSSSDSKEMADSKCALAFEDNRVCASCMQKSDTHLILVPGLRRDILSSECHMPDIINTDLQGAIQLLLHLI